MSQFLYPFFVEENLPVRRLDLPYKFGANSSQTQPKSNFSHELLSILTRFWATNSSDRRTSHESIFSVDGTATGLLGLDLPICARLRLNQAFILSRFNPRCLCTNSPCPCHTSELSENPSGKPRTPLPVIYKFVGFCSGS